MKFVGIVHEIRHELTTNVYGGYATYLNKLREEIADPDREDPIADLVLAGDRLMEDHYLKNGSLLKKLLNKFFAQISIFPKENHKALVKALTKYKPNQPNILYHQFNCFEKPNNEIIRLSRYFNIFLVTTLVDLQDFEYPIFFSKETIDKRRKNYEINYGLSKHILAINSFLKQDAIQYLKWLGINEERVSIVPLGADHILSKNSRGTKKGDDKFVLFPAKAWNHKGHIQLIEAMGKGALPAIPIWITGSIGPIENELQAAIKKYGLEDHVSVLGYLNNDEFEDLFCRASAIIFPSSYEGFGLPYLEAALLKVPIVTFATKSLDSLLPKNSVTSVDIGDFISLIEALNKRILNPQEEMLNIAFQSALKYKWKNTASGTLEVYRKLISDLRKDENL